MIISTVSALLVLGNSFPAQATQATDLPKANTLISAMLAKYHDAKSLSATIHMTQSAMTKSLSFDTELVYERPQKIYLVQKRSDDPLYAPALVSDGVSFAYTAPSNLDDKRIHWLKETTHPKAGQLNIDEMWAELKPELSAGDPSLCLCALISRVFDLRTLVPQMATCENKGRVQIGNRLANDIEGVWKSAGYGQQGTYQIYITDDGELLRQTVKMAFAVSAQWLVNHKLSPTAFPDGILTETTWDVTAKIDQPVNESLFRLPS